MSELFTDVEKAQLERTQNVRSQIITEMLKDGKIPESEENRAFLLKAMEGMDKVNLTKAKIKSDDAAHKNNAAAAAMIGEMLRRVSSRPTGVIRETPPALPDDVVIEAVEGETHIGVKTFSLEHILSSGANKKE
jgi:hypothetical protein